MDIGNNYYFKSFEGINIVYTDYWDFNLVSDKNGSWLNYATNCKGSCNYNIITDGLVTWFDINDSNTTIDGTSLTSLIQWSGTTILPSSGFTLNDWGLTGVDNGRTDCLSGKTLTITSADTKLVLYPVTGFTINYSPTGCTVTNGLYTYPWTFLPNQTTIQGCPVGNTICLDGGFYQGFFRLDTDKPAPTTRCDESCGTTGYTLVSTSATTFWQVMPTEFPVGWSMETWIRWDNGQCEITGGTKLNDIYPNNKNFFFYIGTRAENKFWNDFSGETGLKTSKGIPLQRTASLEYANEVVDPNSGQNWLSTGSGSDIIVCGCNQCGHENYLPVNSGIITGGQNWFSVSSSDISCCQSCGSTDLTTVVTGTTYTYCDQLSENALGFRITDDGKIGYRKMTVSGDCYNNKYRITGTMMEEGYSEAGVVSTGTSWNHIVVTYVAGGTKNTLPSGTLTFWVNGLAKYKVKDFIGIQLRALDEWSDKQIGVPFNLSWGGGTQGLTESQTFDGPDYADRNLWLQQNFAGTFEGQLSQLRFYEKPLNVLEIRNNFFVDCRRYCRPDTFGGAQIVQPNSDLCGTCKNPLPPYILKPCFEVTGSTETILNALLIQNNTQEITFIKIGDNQYLRYI